MKKFILLVTLLLGCLSWAQESVAEGVYGIVPYFQNGNNGLVAIVISGGCTEKSHFSWKIEEEMVGQYPVKAITLLRNKPDHCEAVSHPVDFKFSFEEIGIKPHTLFKIKNQLLDTQYAY